MLLNLFKKPVAEKVLSEDELVKQIHDEVDSLEDKSIKEVEELLASLSIPTVGKINQKADLMKSLGFGHNNETVLQAETIKQDIAAKEKIKADNVNRLKLMNEYRLYYPNDKIIMFSEFEKVLYKYNLIYAPVQAYIKDVPEKNLLEIKKAKYTPSTHEPPKLFAVTEFVIQQTSFYNNSPTSYLQEVVKKLPRIAAVGKKVTKYKICTLPIDLQKEIMSVETGPTLSGVARDRIRWKDWREVSRQEYLDYAERGLIARSYEDIEEPTDELYSRIFEECQKIKQPPASLKNELKYNLKLKVTKVKRDGLFIAAPKTHFDLENLSSWNGKEYYMNQPVKVTLIKDPIAFNILNGVNDECFVRIISKWGTSDDKSYLDPIVQDERMN